MANQSEMSSEESDGLDLGLGGSQVEEQQERAQQAREQDTDEETPGEAIDPQPDNTAATAEDDVQDEDDTEQSPDNDRDDLPSAKDRDDSVMLYLTDELSQQWDMAVTQLKLTWQQAGHDVDELGKLRHLYPLIIRVGIDNVEDLTAAEMQTFIENFEEQDAADLL